MTYVKTLTLICFSYWIGSMNVFEGHQSERTSYLLLLYGEAQTSKDGASINKEYGLWMSSSSQIIDGKELKKQGQKLKLIDTHLETREASQVNGFFIIQASEYKEAFLIAQNCPHLKYGGELELRPIIDN